MTIASILQITQENGGVLTSSLANKLGIHHAMLSYLVSQHKLVRSDRGVYTLPETMDDEFFNAANRYRRGIFSHGCALFLFGLTDRIPDRLEMTFPQTSNVSAPLKNGIQCHRVLASVHDLGKTEAKTPAGNKVVAYSPPRTICDVFKAAKRAPSDEEIGALRRFVKGDQGRASKIFSLARTLKCDNLIRPYLEAMT